MSRLIVIIAQGFGAGRLPFAPGTFGALVGVAWFAALLAPGSLAFFLGGSLAGVLLSVWICGETERMLAQKDPPSVVFDEIAAMPVAFAAWVLTIHSQTGGMPSPAIFLRHHWVITIGVFVAFRLFDIWKPWPVKESQSLPGGWGVTMDDVLAALYVNVVSVPALLWLS